MNLGFQKQFVPFVEDGSKTHTIRAGERWKVGMRADLFARPRQKGMRLLFRAQVVKVDPVCISWEANEEYPDVIIAGNLLTMDERDLFAWRDGFRNGHPSKALGYGGSFDLMMDFWCKTHDLMEKPFHGQIIHWNYEQRFMQKDGGPDLGRDSGKSRELHARSLTHGKDCATNADSRERPA